MNKLVKQTLHVLVSSVALATLSRANVLVVDASGGGSFTQIQPAVDAATDGDTILVKSGVYGAFSVGDKALVIVGDSGASVEVVGSASVQSLAASKTFVLENITANGTTSGSSTSVYGLYLANDAGHVRIENCHFTGASLTGFGAAHDGYDGVHIVACSDAALTRVTSTGGSAPPFPNSCCSYVSGAGVSASGSTVTLYRSTLRGGNGESAGFSAPNGGSGGDGCSASATLLFLSGTACTGGDGGQAGQPAFGAFGGDGGDGIRLSNISTCYELESTQTAGAAGPASPFDPINTSPGNRGVAREGTTFVDLTGSARRMQSPSPVRENTSYAMSFTGTPGEQVALLVSSAADRVLQLPWKGVLLLKAMHPSLSIPVGTIPPAGTLSVTWGAMDLGGLASKTLHVQPVFVDAQGHRTLGNASSTVILSHLY
jgi:hypothetical protein